MRARAIGWGWYVLLASSAIPAVLWGAFVALVPSESNAVDEFLYFRARIAHAVAEDEVMDPLIAARGDVVPRVIAAIPTMGMPLRRYAIGYLGNQGDRRALPLLRSILIDRAQEKVLRGDALLEIARIDLEEGRLLAARYASAESKDSLAFSAKNVLLGELQERRSRSHAIANVIGRHFGIY